MEMGSSKQTSCVCIGLAHKGNNDSRSHRHYIHSPTILAFMYYWEQFKSYSFYHNWIKIKIQMRKWILTGNFVFLPFTHEPLKLPGRKARSKNFKTPFFSRYSKFLSWGSWYRSRTSPKNFFWKYLNKYGR